MSSTDMTTKLIFDRWNGALKSFNTLLASLTDEQMMSEVAPNKNRGVYILGHLIAVHDDVLKLLGLGEKVYPELHRIFIESPDKTVAEMPPVADLRGFWANQCDILKQRFESTPHEEWFQRHTAVSEEDFLKEPHRNKINIILTRTTHLTYHTGQLILLKK
jgi:hypothetical protein